MSVFATIAEILRGAHTQAGGIKTAALLSACQALLPVIGEPARGHLAAREAQLRCHGCVCVCVCVLNRQLCSADKLGTGLALVRSDISGNITRLAAAQSRDPGRYEAVYPIILDEVAHGQPTSSNSDTNGLLWLKRCAAAWCAARASAPQLRLRSFAGPWNSSLRSCSGCAQTQV